jgi:hypothetical protein
MQKPKIIPIQRHPKSFYPLSLLTAAAMLLAFAVSCASAPEYPVYPPPTTETLPVNYQVAFNKVRGVLLEDPRIEIETIDTAGRIVAREKASGFIFWQDRTILDFFLQPTAPEQTRITMYLRAEEYGWGGLTRPAGWYPYSEIDTFLGEDILGLIKKAAAESTNQ